MLCALVCCVANLTGELRALEDIALDACFQIRGERPSQANVVIVSIDDTSLKRLGKPFVQISPELAKVVLHLKQQGAEAIGVDLLIAESADGMPGLRPGAAGDADQMGRAVAASGNVVLAEWIMGKEEPLGPLFQWLGSFQPAWNDIGFVDMTPDDDMCIRHQQLRAQVSDSIHPSFALAMYGKAEELDAEWFTDANLRSASGSPIPQSSGRMRVNYVGPPGTVSRIPFHQVLDSAENGEPLAQTLDGSIVLIGVDTPQMQDIHATPYAGQSTLLTIIPSSWFGYDPALMSGVEIHANVLATIMDETYITTPIWLSTPWLLLLTGAILGSTLIRLNLEHGALLTFVHHFAWKAVAVSAFYLFNWRVEMAAMLLLGPLVYGTVFALRWRWVRKMMGMFKSEAIAKAMELNPGELDLRGQERVVTLFFSDIRGFTTISEGSEPRFVVSLLNDYFAAIVPSIEAHGGVINQYMGDGIMVIFGAPFPQADHAVRAVRAGRAVLDKVHEMNDHWVALGIDNFRIGIGIHTGRAITGTVGAPGRLDYSAIGDTVNSAARIEASTKQLGVELLISQQTYDMIDPKERQELGLSSEAHEISVKGKDQKLCVFTLAGDG